MKMFKRAFDILFSAAGIVVLAPALATLALLVKLDAKGPVFYRQKRVGKGNVDFRLLKFRTMHVDSDKAGLLTVGNRDPRITNVGYWLRKYKLDELPQLINVLKGDMSFVGPRPEVRKYVALYNKEQQQVLSVKPGITDWASIHYSNENELLAQSNDPEQAYVEEVMPAKLRLNLGYIQQNNLIIDIKIILLTLKKIIIH